VRAFKVAPGNLVAVLAKLDRIGVLRWVETRCVRIHFDRVDLVAVGRLILLRVVRLLLHILWLVDRLMTLLESH